MNRSHQYEFTASQVLRLLALPLLLLVLFAVLMHAGKTLLPPPRPMLDLDRTILLHQAEASQRKSQAEIVLIGDSSCLMNVSATALQQQLGRPVLNLATLSYVRMDTHAALIRSFVQNNPRQLKTVVLLLHPESLRLASRNSYFSDIIDATLAGEDYCAANVSKIGCWLGVQIFKGRILAPALPLPLPGAYGSSYGFTWNLWNYMTAHNGSALDPRDFTKAEGSPEFRLATQLKAPFESFRAALPPEIKLLIGITPSPAGFVLPSHDQTCARILQEWAESIRADATLPLPYSLPDDLFASSAHLNAAGVEEYTALVAQALR